MRLSVVIVSHNVCRLLRECLISLLSNLEGTETEVFVVDNNSTDGSVDMVRDQFPWAKLIPVPTNPGYAAANNLGIRQARGEYVLLLNPDTFLPTGSMASMLEFMDAHPEAGVAGPRLELADGSLDRACRRGFPAPDAAFYRLFGLSKLFPNSPRFARYNLTHLDPTSLAEVDSVSGAFMLMRATALEQSGLLDETFFMYGEDLDLAFRIKEKGWKVYYYPSVRVVHYKGQSSRQRSYRATVEFYRAMRIFYRKHYARDHSAAFNWLVICGIELRALVSLGKNALRPHHAKRVGT